MFKTNGRVNSTVTGIIRGFTIDAHGNYSVNIDGTYIHISDKFLASKLSDMLGSKVTAECYWKNGQFHSNKVLEV